MDQFEREYARWQAGEIDRFVLIKWVQENLDGRERNRAITRINIDAAPEDIKESGVTPGAPGMGTANAVVNAIATGGAALRAQGEDYGGGGEQRAGVGSAEQAVYDAYESGAEVTEEMMAAFEAENPAAASAFLDVVGEETGGASGGGTVPSDFENMTPAQALQAAAMEALKRGFEDPLSGGFEEATNLLKVAADSATLEAGAVKLDDGMLITQEMLNHADPVLRAQYQQAFAQRQHAIEEESRVALNAYNLDEYTLDRQKALDLDATAIAQHNAELSTVRERLARDEIDMKQAGAEIERILSGQQESRSRADLITKTQQAAAPYGTVGGKTSFTGADLGAGATATMRQLGHANPGQAEAIRFPGSITLDPAGLMSAGDKAAGVDRALPEIPAISVTDADIPRAPQLQGTGGVPRPELTAPRGAPTIDLPAALLAMLASASQSDPDADLAQRRAFRE